MYNIHFCSDVKPKGKEPANAAKGTYNPASGKYHPIDDATWKRSEK